MNVEWELIYDFHCERCKAIAETIVAELIKLRPGGLFLDQAECENLWDEACWAVQAPDDLAAQEAASATFEQFASGWVGDLSLQELKMHGYILSEELDEEGQPYADEDLVATEVADRVASIASQRDISELGCKR